MRPRRRRSCKGGTPRAERSGEASTASNVLNRLPLGLADVHVEREAPSLPRGCLHVPAGTPGLNVYFVGNAGAPPLLQSIGFAPAVDPFVVYVDSTVCDQNGAEFGGWGQQLPQFFDFPVVVANYADSGESSGSFLNAAPLFGAIESQLKEPEGPGTLR
jgi:hypothetical protein